MNGLSDQFKALLPSTHFVTIAIELAPPTVPRARWSTPLSSTFGSADNIAVAVPHRTTHKDGSALP